MRIDDDLDGWHGYAPRWMVTLIEPSVSTCSTADVLVDVPPIWPSPQRKLEETGPGTVALSPASLIVVEMQLRLVDIATDWIDPVGGRRAQWQLNRGLGS